ncbi:tetratricopeptide repeat protein [Nostoc sp.]|uniref:tetratricopeptide repeat protein n=1 Tax=Nostoc sp. TaxID=1180 RepID=UPI002FF79A0A
MNQNLAIICSLLFLPFPVFANETSSPTISQAASEISSCEIKADNENDDYSENQLQTLASSITVRIIGDNNGGSGTLLAKRGNTYLVLSNSHVVRGVNSISLQTSDGKTYAAQIVPNTNFEKFDLALLQFQSNQNYCLPKEIAQSIPGAETPVMAAGYSGEKGQIVFRTGKVQQIAEKPLKEGYQIGYNSNIEQGMSGGAILNSRGELIGINGRSAYPILNTGYVYPDGSRPTESEIKRMRSVSWGIPVSTFLAQVNTEILTAYSLPLPNIPDENTPKVLTGWLGELEQKAKQITVRIDSTSGANGSGVIIAKDGDTYTVLTASHVVCENTTQECGHYNYQILAPDGKQYPVERSTIKTESGVDLAVVKFTASNQNYQVAILGEYNPNNYDYMFTAGYPKLSNNSSWRFTMGRIFEKEEGLLRLVLSNFKSENSSKLQNTSSLSGGYGLVYTSITYGGMSGGPVLDTMGRVIGIHGEAEGEQAYDQQTGDSGSSRGKVQLGYSLGIPINTFLGIATRLGVQANKVETTPASQLNVQQVQSIKEAILSTDISRGNTTASQWLERGNQLWRLGRYKEAVQAFDEAIKLKPSFVYLAYYGKGLALSADNKYQEAVAALEKAVNLKDDFVAAWQTQSAAYQKLNQFDQALIAIDKAIQKQPNNPNVYYDKSLLLFLLKRYAEAEAAINKAIELNPRPPFYFVRGILYSLQSLLYSEHKKLDLALADINRAIAINPQYAPAYDIRATLYSWQKKSDLALADYTKAIAINPQYADAYINRGNFYKEQKKSDLALADYTKAIAINPQYANAYINRGNFYKEQKKSDLALADYNKAIAINPQYADAYNNRGNFYKEQKKWDLAADDYTKAIAIDPQFFLAYINRGIFYKEQKKWDLAADDYTKAIAINPQFFLAYIERGNIYKEQKKWDLALADSTQAITINPQYADAYNNRGIVYYEQKKWELAEVDYTKAIAINPQYVDAYYNRGIVYYDQKKWELAEVDYTKAIAINPQYALAYNNRGNIYYDQKKWELAEVDYTKAIAINPQYADAYNNRGNIYKEQKKWELAEVDYTKAIAINPQYALAYNNRGNLYKEQKKWELALADFTKAIAINPEDAEAYVHRGDIYSDQKKWELALADYNKAIAINPQYALAYLSRGMVYLNNGEPQKAVPDLQQAAQIFQAEGNTDAYERVINILKELQKILKELQK